jgi:hypothetical protein
MNQAKMNANLKEMREEIKSGQPEMRSRLNAWVANMRNDQKEMMPCQVTMEACLDSKDINPGRHEIQKRTSRVPYRRGCSEIYGSREITGCAEVA